MGKNRVFTEEELKEMATSPKEVAIEALRAGDKETAENGIRKFAETAQGMHDSYVNIVAGLMDFIYVHDGEEVLYQALRESLRPITEQMAESFGKEDFRKQVQMLAAAMHGHLHGPLLDIREDDEKVTLKMKPCGSGQMLVECGAYESPRNLHRIEPHRITWGLPNFPVYCAHAPVTEILAIEKQGYPVYTNFPAKEMARECCDFVVYKDPKYIPDEVYTRVGMERPKNV